MDLYEQPRRQEYRHWLNSQPDTTPTIQPRRFSGNEQPVTTLDTALRNTSVVQNTGSLSQTPPYTVSHHLPSQDEIRRNAGDAAEARAKKHKRPKGKLSLQLQREQKEHRRRTAATDRAINNGLPPPGVITPHTRIRLGALDRQRNAHNQVVSRKPYNGPQLPLPSSMPRPSLSSPTPQSSAPPSVERRSKKSQFATLDEPNKGPNLLPTHISTSASSQARPSPSPERTARGLIKPDPRQKLPSASPTSFSKTSSFKIPPSHVPEPERPPRKKARLTTPDQAKMPSEPSSTPKSLPTTSSSDSSALPSPELERLPQRTDISTTKARHDRGNYVQHGDKDTGKASAAPNKKSCSFM